ncbi:AAA family ATPase [Pseudobacteroides cellulosolvens]|uniref:Endonuclease GajA/Old nuclease/RecF-like AAA domain-containing protein n=1 Tax=Pseudobacteroides cellulosolvens ATCC 35603 = DSM 2933 TaxID=398512 RepID=A0A0L6JUX4_9FIRM|nr:AAA family ATPase [Pseudobacteroides cellulosolvens]KNY29524.1 hypothetical protein Bccel_4798 [Pseudobacteroides cellulosolvens ATCC 35603 = DSM 2933]
MRLVKARVKGYRSIKDTGYFEIENLKTIFVGPNEAGKTAILQALQKLNPPEGVPLFNPLRDYPRSLHDEHIISGKIDPSSYTVVEGHFTLTEEEKEIIPDGYGNIIYVFGRNLDNSTWHRIDNGIEMLTYGNISKDLMRLTAHIDKTFENNGSEQTVSKPSEKLKTITDAFNDKSALSETQSNALSAWLDDNFVYIDENNKTEEQRFDKIKNMLALVSVRSEVLKKCRSQLPKFILFNNYFRVKPSIHLELLAQRTEQNILDDEQYDYGNNCLLKLLGFTARELSDAGKANVANPNDSNSLQKYKDQLDNRSYRLNAASVRLTNEIRKVWNPSSKRAEASKLVIKADNQYLKVVVEDELGVEVELDQRSEGFQWLVSFFVVFFAESEDKHKNAILLLDEPGMSLHGLKQAEFRETITRLSEKNQTIFTTHSPFLVGANELDLVRVIEMNSREEGTIVHTSITANDAAAMLPLQEALGYDLAQSLFVHQKNLVLEGLTDYWYLEAISNLLEEENKTGIDKNIALIPASSASKVTYFATILHAQNLKVAALLDSDASGDQAATQDTLVSTLGNKRILRTKDFYKGKVLKSEIEDLLRDTLVKIAKDILGWDIVELSFAQISRPIIDIFVKEVGNDFSKYKLAKAFLRWSRDHSFSDLTSIEKEQCELLVDKINKSLK